MKYSYEEPIRFLDENVRREAETREIGMEQKIRKLWRQSSRGGRGGDFMHFGGVMHIFGEYHNLFERLKDFNPERYRLNEF